MRPITSLQINKPMVLSWLGNEKNPATVARIINAFKIPVFVVHPFYSEQNSLRACLLGCNKPYFDYRARATTLMSGFSRETWQRTVVLVESLDAQELASHLLQANSINSNGRTYFMSILGEMPNPFEQDMGRLNPEQLQFNLQHGGFEKIESLVQSGIIFTFGLYKGACLDKAQGELTAIAQKNGVYSFQIASNEMFSI